MNIQKVAFWESDENGHCTYASPALCKIMGRSESEIMFSNWTSWLHPDDKERVVSSWQVSVREKASFDEQYRFKKADGSWVKVWGFAFPMHKGKLGKLFQMEEPYFEK